jgi:photosystem II stability/assembly factor-like uncharacterized protein
MKIYNYRTICLILYYVFSQSCFAHLDQPINSTLNHNWVPFYKDKTSRVSPKIKETTRDPHSLGINKFTEKFNYHPLLKSTETTGWVKMDLPIGGSIRRFYEFGSVLYAISDREIYVYENHMWKSLNFGNHLCNFVLCIYKYESGRILVGTDFDFYYSDDNGATWNIINMDGNYTSVCDIYKTKNGELLLSTTNGIYISGTEPEKFSPLTLKNSWVSSVTIDNFDNIWAGTSSGVYMAKYSDLVWTKTGLDDAFYGKIVVDSNNVIYTFSIYNIYMTKDLGNTWYSLDGYIICDISKDINENLIVTNGNNILFVDTSGVKLTSCNHEISLYTAYSSKNNEILIGTSSIGAQYYDKQNDVFSDFGNNGLSVATVRALEQMGNGEILASTDADSLYVSNDDGLTWKSIIHGGSMCMRVCKDNSIYAYIGAGLSKSTDFGRSWLILNSGLSSWSIRAFDVSDDYKIICAGTYDGSILLSTDSGNSFKIIKGANEDYYFTAIKIINNNTFLIGNAVLYGAGAGPLLYTNDAGKTFKNLQGNYSVGVTAITKDYSGNIYLASRDGVFKSTDGYNWHSVLSQQDIKFLRKDKFDNIYAATIYGAVYCSNDQGINWDQIAAPLWNTFTDSFTLTDDGYILNGTQERGIFRAKVEIKKREVFEYSLSQNYPNPFNPTTTINYSIPNTGNVKITVFNAIGCKVSTIVDEYKSPGNYSFKFNGSKMASGIYLYRLESGNYTVSKKFVLIK